MTRAELEALDHALVTALVRVRRQLAHLPHSGSSSPTGIGAPGQGDTECDDSEMNEYMDRTIEEKASSDGASLSPAQTAARLLSRSRQRQRHKPLPIVPARRLRGAR